jgi:hypothetical protein
MNALQITVLVVLVISLAAVMSYLFYEAKPNQDSNQYTPPPYTQDELDNIKLAEELYNKDLRSQAAKAAEDIEVVDAQLVKPKQIKPEFPIDKPKKKRPANRKKKA